MKSEVPKPLFPFEGKPMIRQVIEALEHTEGMRLPIIVVGHQGDLIRAELGDAYRYATQTELNGTAMAVQAAASLLEPEVPSLILYGDNPFITAASFARMRDYFAADHPTMAMFSVTVPDFDDWRAPFVGFGRVKRDPSGRVTGVVEYKNADAGEREIKEITPGGNCFDTAWLLTALPRVKANPNTGEYYLTELTEIAMVDGGTVLTVPLPPHEAIGINSVEDAENATRRKQ